MPWLAFSRKPPSAGAASAGPAVEPPPTPAVIPRRTGSGRTNRTGGSAAHRRIDASRPGGGCRCGRTDWSHVILDPARKRRRLRVEERAEHDALFVTGTPPMVAVSPVSKLVPNTSPVSAGGRPGGGRHRERKALGELGGPAGGVGRGRRDARARRDRDVKRHVERGFVRRDRQVAPCPARSLLPENPEGSRRGRVRVEVERVVPGVVLSVPWMRTLPPAAAFGAVISTVSRIGKF